ncbi:alpha/beta hydrolase [Lactococcus ileimucosae]|uniref:alpha/beta hydrolase n=1 Tax=Lactococcus ileimucosae TaxID=2941329 RepID=UPI003513047C
MTEHLTLTTTWDKVFPLSDKVDHKKVTFTNHFGITLAADMYIPKGATDKLPAFAVGGPFGAVKEQSSGLYAQEMAERGFITIAFDPSFIGESGGVPRYIQSPDINTEDFQAAVDFLANQENVDADKIGIIGICGWGGIALNAAAIDTRIKVSIVSTMYDMSRIAGNGYFDAEDNEEGRYKQRKALSDQRTADFASGEYALAGGLPKERPQDPAPQFLKEYWDYYKTDRGYHKNSVNSNNGWVIQSNTSFANTRFLHYSNEIRSAVLLIHGDTAHSYYFGKDAFAKLTGDNKKMMTIKGATHTDLYDQKDIIPFDEIESFAKANM